MELKSDGRAPLVGGYGLRGYSKNRRSKRRRGARNRDTTKSIMKIYPPNKANALLRAKSVHFEVIFHDGTSFPA